MREQHKSDTLNIFGSRAIYWNQWAEWCVWIVFLFVVNRLSFRSLLPKRSVTSFIFWEGPDWMHARKHLTDCFYLHFVDRSSKVRLSFGKSSALISNYKIQISSCIVVLGFTRVGSSRGCKMLVARYSSVLWFQGPLMALQRWYEQKEGWPIGFRSQLDFAQCFKVLGRASDMNKLHSLRHTASDFMVFVGMKFIAMGREGIASSKTLDLQILSTACGVVIFSALQLSLV